MKFNRYKNGNARRKLRNKYKHSGIVCCPVCGVTLDWEHPYQPNSAEIDEVIPISRIPDAYKMQACLDPRNTQVLCRRCNKQKSNKLDWQPGKEEDKPKAEIPPTTHDW